MSSPRRSIDLIPPEKFEWYAALRQKTNSDVVLLQLVNRSFERDPVVRYLVSEKVPHKEDKETWKRVVAVVVTGKPHQFKEYPFEVDPSSCNDS